MRRRSASRTTRSPRRHVTVLALISTLAAMLVTGTGAASAHAAANHRAASVTSGDARFQVLSPTLIRTEYAQDGKFTDSATFNAIGRTAFTPPPYTSSTSNGWLTITTSALTLKYQVDSGPFDAQNLSVHLSAAWVGGRREPVAPAHLRSGCPVRGRATAPQRGRCRHGPRRLHRVRVPRRFRGDGRLRVGRRQCQRGGDVHIRRALRQLRRRGRPEHHPHPHAVGGRRREPHGESADHRQLEHLGSREQRGPTRRRAAR